MSEANLKSKIWVQALIRQCELNGAIAMIVAKGDPDAGAVLVKINTLGRGCMVLSQVRTGGGEKAWMRATGDDLVPEADADAYIARQRGYDEDLWVVEIEDREGRHPLADKIL